jgi:hypothetical protein
MTFGTFYFVDKFGPHLLCANPTRNLKIVTLLEENEDFIL